MPAIRVHARECFVCKNHAKLIVNEDHTFIEPMRESSPRRESRKIEVQLQAIRRKLRASLEREYQRGGLATPQRLVMSEVVRDDGLGLKELSLRISLAHSAVSVIVSRLVEPVLLERRTQQPDLRVSRIFATAAVREFLQKNGPELSLGPLVSALAKASASELKAITVGLETLERFLS
jgi:DNA-binding MarR family transcriptional regulator